MKDIGLVHRFFKSIYLILKAAVKTETRKDRFTRYALMNKWNNEESVSGDGSTLAFTANLRKELPKLLENFNIERLFDAPCGDFNWLKTVDLTKVKYIGGDIVPEIIEINQRVHVDHNVVFKEFDIVKDRFPDSDLWLCRDCLFHFSESDIFDTLANFLKSDIDYLLTTCSPECKENQDIRTGSYRELNLMISPFNLPAPELWIDDWIDPHPVQKLGLWRKSTLLKALGSRKEIQKFM